MDARSELERLIEERREDYAGLSRMLGRNPAYIQQFIKRGTPRKLAEDDRRRLALYFDVPESRLGGPDAPPKEAFVPVPRLDIGASAGPGAFAGDERARNMLGFDKAWLRTLTRGDISQLSMIRVDGDSMTPTLSDGDEILVDGSDGAGRLRDGIYVLRLDGALVVKRLSIHPAASCLSIVSDNPAYPSWPECDASAIDVVGRVVWVGRQLR